MNKIIKIIIINITTIILLIFIANYIYICLYNSSIYSLSFYLTTFKKESFDSLYARIKKEGYFRDALLYKDSKKRPIILFGCSYTYGQDLEDEQTLAYKLAKLSGRNVYNRAIQGLGIQYLVYKLENLNIHKEIPNPEYIIYVYSACHNIRLYKGYQRGVDGGKSIVYEYNNGNLKRTDIKTSILDYIFMYRKERGTLQEEILERNRNYTKDFKLIEALFLRANELIKEFFPNTKFVILLYQDYNEPWFYESKNWQKLKDNGIIVLDAVKITNLDCLFDDEKYMSNTHHPKEQAWDIIAPALVRELNL